MRRERFGLVLLDSEKRALERLAEAEGGLSQAALLRRLVRKAAKERGLWPVAEDQEKGNQEVPPAR